MTTRCPVGKERMRRLMTMIEHGRVDLTSLVTHRFALDNIEAAFDLFSRQRDGVLMVALYGTRAYPRPTLIRASTMRQPWPAGSAMTGLRSSSTISGTSSASLETRNSTSRNASMSAAGWPRYPWSSL